MINPVVYNQYERQGDVECPKCGVDGVDNMGVLNLTLGGIAVARMVSPKQGWHGNKR